jgi:hypothetical protein
VNLGGRLLIGRAIHVPNGLDSGNSFADRELDEYLADERAEGQYQALLILHISDKLFLSEVEN